MRDEIDLFEWGRLFFKWKRPIVFFVGLVTVATLIYSLFMPKLYMAHATLLPISDQKKSGGLSLPSSFSLPFVGFGIGESSVSNEQLIDILTSRIMQLRVVERFTVTELNKRLFKGERPKGEEIPAEELIGSIPITPRVVRSLIVIEAVQQDPQLAADVANAYTEELGLFLNEHSLNLNFQVIDAAIPPKNKFKPNRRKILTVSFFVSLLLSGLFVLAIETMRTRASETKPAEERG